VLSSDQFPTRKRGEFIADIHHGVTAFTLPIVDPEAEAFVAGVIPEFGDKSISLVHSSLDFESISHRTILSGCQ
jgi:hypothetical protein